MAEEAAGEVKVPQVIDTNSLKDIYVEQSGLRLYKPMRLIIRDGSPVDGLYLLMEGTIGFYKNGHYLGHQEHTQSTFFGEMGVILQENKRNADVVSLTDCAVKVVPGSLQEIVRHRPDITMKLMVANSRRVLNLNRIIDELRKENEQLKENRIHVADIWDEVSRLYKKAQELPYGQARVAVLKMIIELVEGGKRPQGVSGLHRKYFISGLLDLLVRSK